MVRKLVPEEKVPSRDWPWMSDPVAKKTEWVALASGGTNICTHRLKEGRAGCRHFVMTLGAKAFASVFLGMGIGISVFLVYQMWQEHGGQPSLQMLLPLLVGGVFAGVGVFLLRSLSRPRVFDRNLGLYWSTRKPPENLESVSRYKEWVYLQEIHALQILREYVRGDKSSYYSYELNLVMDDGQRLNVVDHGSLHKLREDADELSRFLGVPLWDSTKD